MTVAWLYLVATLIGLWFTKQALWPVAPPAVRSLASFFAAWLTNELVFHHLAWQAAATGIFIWLGALQHWAGWLGLAITVAQWVGMGVIIRRIFAARDAAQIAVDEVTDQFGELREEVGGPEDAEGVRWGQLVFPFPIRHRRVEREPGITFARDGGIDLELDVYRRDDHPEGRPVLLYVHGGAWVISNRNEQGLPLMQEMAARGWVGVNADYRLSPFATFPDHIVDVKRAIVWIREHADEIGADPAFIAIAGGSAGGHLAALAALSNGDPRFQPGFEDADATVQAAVPFYGVYDLRNLTGAYRYATEWEWFLNRFVFKATYDDDPERYRAASPLERVHEDAPPFLVIHGSKDSFVPAETARAFVERLREVSRQPVGYAELPGTQHAFDVFPSLRTAYVLDTIARFLQHAYAHRRLETREDLTREDLTWSA